MRTEGDFIKINRWLLPLSWIYGLVVSLRNRLFDMHILKEHSFTVPVISVGNLTVGGTGKTPHVEYLVDLLRKHSQVAVLSRGYKRKSKGYVLATSDSTMEDLGDEPYQMKQKFSGIYVAVDKKRVEGIERLTHDEETNNTDVILLDDAFQHRYVKPGINILLIDYHRLVSHDRLLPAGRLREPKSGVKRADMVIITKCPRDLKPMEFRILRKNLSLLAYQELFFTTLSYGELTPVFTEAPLRPLNELTTADHVLLLTGIASPQQMVEDVGQFTQNIHPLHFSDHHQFSAKDVERINDAFAEIPEPKIVITTEKDRTRLEHLDGLSPEVRQHLFALPVKIKFMLDQEENFNSKILSYVQKNSRNSILVKGKDDHKPKDSHSAGNGPRTISFRNN